MGATATARKGFTVSPVVIFAHAAHGDAGNISLAGAAGLKTAAVRQAAPTAVVKIAKGNGTVLIRSAQDSPSSPGRTGERRKEP